MNKGIKNKNYWISELGCTYIPIDELEVDIKHLAEGGLIDDDSVNQLPPNLREQLIVPLSDSKKDESNTEQQVEPLKEPQQPVQTVEPPVNFLLSIPPPPLPPQLQQPNPMQIPNENHFLEQHIKNHFNHMQQSSQLQNNPMFLNQLRPAHLQTNGFLSNANQFVTQDQSLLKNHMQQPNSLQSGTQ
jgi:hypothetical protein